MEFQFYMVSPLIMWAAFSPRRKALRRFGLAGLALGSLLGVLINAVVMLVAGPAGFGDIMYVFTLARSPPYFSGLLTSVVVARVQHRALPITASSTATAPPGAAGDKAAAEERSKCSSSGGGGNSDSGGQAVESSGGGSIAAPSPGAEGPMEQRDETAATAGSVLPPAALAITVIPRCNPAEGTGADTPSSCSTGAGLVQLARRRMGLRAWRRPLLWAAEGLAVALCCTLAYTGAGRNE